MGHATSKVDEWVDDVKLRVAFNDECARLQALVYLEH